ncbi:MAG TPA: glycosyltransferase [Candidatus Saccharimonadales bacterium]|nr:glycosyltransferase [Candidatus Saccharimonadales bacterium]
MMRRIGWGLTVVIATLLMMAPVAAQNVVYLRDTNARQRSLAVPPGNVVLTFDDGPSAYTGQILDILRQNHVPATFFVIGKQAVKWRGVVRQLYAAGEEIGNHTFTHPNPATIPTWRLKYELNLTRLVIVSETGHSTRLVRPPYLGSDSLTHSSHSVIDWLSAQGYVVAGENIDTDDWRRPGVDSIVRSAATLPGGIILLHDGGGNRSQTVTALPRIISYYKSQGYRFTTLAGALELSGTQLMPPANRAELGLATLSYLLFTAAHAVGIGLYWLIVVLIVAAFGRALLVLVASLLQTRSRFRYGFPPAVHCSVVVPAYNEEKVIVACLQSVLKSRYPFFEVIVVDDGSLDETAALARAIGDRRLRVVRKPNGGKASALNYGIALAHHQVIVAIDADTIFKPNTLTRLTRHFCLPEVGAVSGNTKVVNRHRLITKLQSLEYIVGFNLDRRMGDLFDCITVVPGAIGAFRKKALLQARGFSKDTLAEDTDLTLTIKELGYKIVYDESAIAYTEAPATVRDLLKQRFRWSFGTMQSAWKHRRSLFNPRQGTLGLIGLPYLVFYQILFPLIGPFFDMALVLGLLSHRYQLMLVSLLVYTALDIFSSAIALKLDGESLRQLWLIVPQRLLYRQMMYYVIVRSAYNALRGRLVGWGKAKREGSHLAKA